MKLLEAGRAIPDPWVRVDDIANGLPDAPAILAAGDLAAAIALEHRHPLGVALDPQDDPDILSAHLDNLALVTVRFPIFRDGRAFTQARKLREYLGFAGDIRAEGHILPDQYGFLLRCGVTSIALPDDADFAPWHDAASRFDIAYQHGRNDGPSVGTGMRRRLNLAG